MIRNIIEVNESQEELSMFNVKNSKIQSIV